jgi:ABC-type transporter Mla MlaB component
MSFGGPAGLSPKMTANEGPRLAAQKMSPVKPSSGSRPPPEPDMTILLLSGPIARTDIAAICARAREMLEGSDADPVICDVGALEDNDAVTVDALARMQLTARRVGRRIRLRHACGELQELLAFLGLSDVLPVGAASGLEPGRKAEQGEQARRVEEEADPGDPAL